MKEKFLKRKFMFQGVAIGFRCDEVLLPNKKKASREYMDHPGAAVILPFIDSPRTHSLDKARIILVKQYRYPIAQVTEELPAGKLDPNENLKSCLSRELKE